MAFKIQDSLTWISRAFGIDRASEVGDSPRLVTDTIQAVVAAQGWQNLRPQFVTQTTTNGTSVVLPGPSETEAFLYLTLQFRHTQAATRDILIFYADGEGNVSGIEGEFQATVNVDFTLSRPILVAPGHSIGVVSQQTVTGDLIVSSHFVILAAGEYVPGNPYG